MKVSREAQDNYRWWMRVVHGRTVAGDRLVDRDSLQGICLSCGFIGQVTKNRDVTAATCNICEAPKVCNLMLVDTVAPELEYTFEDYLDDKFR